MAKALVVVESPAKAKTINKYLGKNYKVIASMGHVRDLPKSKLGVDIEDGFEPSYEVILSRKKVLKELKDALAGTDIEAVKRGHENLVTVSQDFAQRLYANAQQAQNAADAGAGAGAGASAADDDEVADAEIVDDEPDEQSA